MHQPREFLAQDVVADAPFVQRARLEILDQDIGRLEQLHQHRAAAGGCEIEADRALVAVDADEIGRILLMEGRAPIASFIARGRLDLDHIGAVVGEDLRAIGTAKHARKIDHSQSGHGTGGGGSFGRHGSIL